MNNDRVSQSMGTMLSAFFGFCIVAATIFAGWHVILRYAPANPYKAPQKPYVSVSKPMGQHRVANLERDFEHQIMNFWRFGVV